MQTLDARGLPAAEIAAKLARDREPFDRAMAAAREIVERVAAQGDRGLLEATERLDGVRPPRLLLGRGDLRAALERIPVELRDALDFAAKQIETFHRAQVPLGYEVTIGPRGSRAGQQPRALDRVGVYVPGGPRGYPSSVLMGVIPARLAGVREILVATPPSRDTGLPPDSVLAAATLAGADEILVAGGAQAIAAMALGTETVKVVDKIVGPGNVYVTAAKLLVQDRVATDGIAGPSEVVVIADETLSTEALAAELLAQAEHDPDAVAIAILADSRDFQQILENVNERMRVIPRRDAVQEALRRNGFLMWADSVSTAIEVANILAPEHLVLAVRDAASYLYAVRNAGCVFLGSSTSAAMGDYTAGTNHVLPTAGTARWRGGLGVRDFVKFVSYVEVTREDVSTLAEPAMVLAREEGFEAHAAALASRIADAKAVVR